MADPLVAFPPEVCLRMLNFVTVKSLARLSTVSKQWHAFIEGPYQEGIYRSLVVPECSPHNKPDLPTFLENAECFSPRSFQGVDTWKELCRRRCDLQKKWSRPFEYLKASVMASSNSPTDVYPLTFWPDFRRRLIVSDFRPGIILVCDMHTNYAVWEMRGEGLRTDERSQYSDGWLVRMLKDNSIQAWVWQAGPDGRAQPRFERTFLVPNPVDVIDFVLSPHSLTLMLKDEGRLAIWVYDTSRPQMKRQRRFFIDEFNKPPCGPMIQHEEILMYSVGDRYYVLDHMTGALLGEIQPKFRRCRYHVDLANQPPDPDNDGMFEPEPMEHLSAVEVKHGPLPGHRQGDERLKDDQWVLACIDGSTMVGMSKFRRIYICPDWRSGMKSTAALQRRATIIEFSARPYARPEWAEKEVTRGQLSMKGDRIAFLARHHICVVGLDDEGYPRTSSRTDQTHAFTIAASHRGIPSRDQLRLYEDCLMFSSPRMLHGTGIREFGHKIFIRSDPKRRLDESSNA